MEFSIIIPTYNNSDYLKVCLQSLFRQDFPKNEYEVIVVDDASTENIEEAILESKRIYTSDYKHNTPPRTQNNIHTTTLNNSLHGEEFPNVRLIRHTENKRQGGARNTGLRQAKGNYIFFLDSDDYWNATNTLRVFHSILQLHDFDIVRSVVWDNVAVANFESVEWNGDVIQMTGKEHLASDELFYEIWTSCYKSEFLHRQDCYFRENVVYEDSDWTVKVFWTAQDIGIVNFPFYIYRQNPDSTTMKPRVQSFKDNILSLSSIEDFILNVDMPEDCKKVCYSRIKKSILSYIRISRNYPVQTSLECIGGIRRTLLTDMSHYDGMSTNDKIKFGLLSHCPVIIIVPVRVLTLMKRFILRCLRK